MVIEEALATNENEDLHCYIHNHYTRFSKHNYQVPMSNSDKGLNSLAKLGTKVWSEIPNDIKVNPSIQSFVNSYKSILFKSY